MYTNKANGSSEDKPKQGSDISLNTQDLNTENPNGKDITPTFQITPTFTEDFNNEITPPATVSGDLSGRQSLKLSLKSLGNTPVLLSPKGSPLAMQNGGNSNGNQTQDFFGRRLSHNQLHSISPFQFQESSLQGSKPFPGGNQQGFPWNSASSNEMSSPLIGTSPLSTAKNSPTQQLKSLSIDTKPMDTNGPAQSLQRMPSNGSALKHSTALRSRQSGRIRSSSTTNRESTVMSPLIGSIANGKANSPGNESTKQFPSLLQSNFKDRNEQTYQRQEKSYLSGIARYKDKYRVNDDYYNKTVELADDDVNAAFESTGDDEYDQSKAQTTESIDDTPGIEKSKQEQALATIAKQFGMNLSDISEKADYSIEPTALLDILDKNDDIQMTENQSVNDRIEWHLLLEAVLTGDVVTGEKRKLIRPFTDSDTDNFLRASYKEDLWIGIRSKLYGREEETQKRLVLYHRGLADTSIDAIMNFSLELPDDVKEMPFSEQVKFASVKVDKVLDDYDKCLELWRTSKEMQNDKPLCSTPEFITRLNALSAWSSVTKAIERESTVLKRWVGNDELDILKPLDNDLINSDRNNGEEKIFIDDRSFIERILKEKDIEDLVERRLFAGASRWSFKAKEASLEHHNTFEELGLPSYIDNLLVLATFPSKLMKEIIKLRIDYSKKLKNPTMMIIDQVLEDFKLYIKLALEVRTSFIEYRAPREGWSSLNDNQDQEFDDTILECVHHYLYLLNRKLLDSPKSTKSFRTFKEPEELEREWNFLQSMGFYIEGGSTEISEQFTILTTKLVARLNNYLQQQLQGPPYDGTTLDRNKIIRWYSSTMDNFGQLRRKFWRFNQILNSSFQNCLTYNLNGYKLRKLLERLKESNHVLYHSSSLAEDGAYIFASESLAERPSEVQRILKATLLGVDYNTIPRKHIHIMRRFNRIADYNNDMKILYGNDNSPDKREEREDPQLSPHVPLDELETETDASEEDPSMDYVLVLYPTKAMMWDGNVVSFEFDSKSLSLPTPEKGKLLLIGRTEKNNHIDKCGEWFKECVGDSIGSMISKTCFLPRVQKELSVAQKIFYRMGCFVIDSAPSVRNQCRGISDCQEIVNSYFTYIKDFGADVAKSFDSVRKSNIILKLIRCSIEWLSFIVDDCVPTDPKTFRWCVSALEFAMETSRGINILTLDSLLFDKLKDKVAGCMSLLISHFDIMGARTKELQKKSLLNYAHHQTKDIYTMDDESLGSLRENIMMKVTKLEEDRRQLQIEQEAVGRVLDDTDTQNKFLTYLASSFSSVSIRWQKGKFLGGGTFGSVFASINLDTGGTMAVKEIKFQDIQSMKKSVPAIKSEISVLEKLSHPNIVQFFGVEVHRDRVYIFMEYCSGGSLAGLLEYGRIEDESVIQLYTLQMLEGLAYLHQLGVVHRDIKPENILLDHMGVIKFIDFGSAKLIAMTNQSVSTPSAGPTPSTSSSSLGGGSSPSTSEIPTPLANPQQQPNIFLSGLKSQGLTGTPMYMSPETIKGESISKLEAIDIWSLGCCVLEMATGRRPWAHLDNEFAVMYHIAGGHLPQFPSPDQLSPMGQEFLRKCLNPDPYGRNSSVELLQDPWIQAIRLEAFSDSLAGSFSEDTYSS